MCTDRAATYELLMLLLLRPAAADTAAAAAAAGDPGLLVLSLLLQSYARVEVR